MIRLVMALVLVAALQEPQASVVVRIQGGKTTFHVGEEISLELEFRGKAGPDYYFSTENYDRSGRLRTEDYRITPQDGLVDPLSDLFADGYIGGGGRSDHPLDDTAFLLHVSLNDWFRFTRPGSYRMVVSSGRLHRHSSQSAPALTSSPVDFTIIPGDAAWASSQIKTATDLIDGGSPDNVKRGAALLRYLDTEAAALALLDRYDAIAKAGAWDIQAALVASSNRLLLISRMEARLDAGDSLEPSFLSTLARLRALVEVPPAAGNGAERLERRIAIQSAYDARWHAALARRPSTVSTLDAELARLSTVTDPQLLRQMADDFSRNPAEAAAAFVALPGDTQWLLLNTPELWSYVNRPWILPALRRVFADWNGKATGFPAGDLALKRLYETAPDEGRRLILDEIRSGNRQIGYEALAILPDTEISDLDAALEKRYSSPRPTDAADVFRDNGTTAWLISRYGSVKLLPFVTNVLEYGHPVCVAEGGFIAYLFKHNAAAAIKRLDPNRTRMPGTCVGPLQALVAHFWDDRVEAAAIAQLDASSVTDVVDAAQVLGAHGSAAAKKPLLDRLVKWSAEWKGRSDELASLRREYTSPGRIENFVVNALMQNQNFPLTISEIANIHALCVTDQCRTNVDAQGPGNRARIQIR